MGGLPSSYLIKNFPSIKLAIFDRNFSSIEDFIHHTITKKAYLNKMLLYMYKFIFPFTNTNLSYNYITSSMTNKIIISDHKDEIIKFKASLLAGVNRLFISYKFDILNNINDTNCINYDCKTFNKYSFKNKVNNKYLLEYILNDIEYCKFVNSIGVLIENRLIINEKYDLKIKNRFLIDTLYLDCNEHYDNNNNTELSEIDIKMNNYNVDDFSYNEEHSLIDNNKNNTIKNKDYKNYKNNIIYKLYNNFKDIKRKTTINYLHKNNYFCNSDFADIIEVIENFDSGNILITNLIDYDILDKEEFINYFFENLYIRGSYFKLMYNTSPNKNNSNYLSKFSIYDSLSSIARNQALENINTMIKCITDIINNKSSNCNLNEFKVNVYEVFVSGLKKIAKFFFETPISADEDKILGGYVPINCGHNGILPNDVYEYLKLSINE